MASRRMRQPEKQICAVRIRMTGVLTTRRQAFAHAERLGRALEETCFAYEVPDSGPYRHAYAMGYRYAVCAPLEKLTHFVQGVVFIEPCEYDIAVKKRIRLRKPASTEKVYRGIARRAKKKPLTSISRNQGPS